MKPYFVGRIHEPLGPPDYTNWLYNHEDFSKMPALIPIPKTRRMRKRLQTESVNKDEGKLVIDENPEDGNEAKDDEYPSNE